MLLDIQISNTLIDQYQKYCENNGAEGIHKKYCNQYVVFQINLVPLSVMGLKSNLWPFSSLQNVILPTEVITIDYTMLRKMFAVTCTNKTLCK
jgi:hypothetical protein